MDAMGIQAPVSVPESAPARPGALRRALGRRRARRAARRADQSAAAAAALYTALQEWADGSDERARFVRALATECRGVWLREAAAGRLRRWFLTTDHEGMSDLVVSVDLAGLRQALRRGRVAGEQANLAMLRRIVG
ncbi:hypothetical protein [Parafrankia discariae]|uniref:hypothetical protein n=1 Tax=Parafrankia discariae TaxID=365528 RepID=UPI001E3C614B|nr:hypothetical protein [Parafrankia discariae]